MPGSSNGYTPSAVTSTLRPFSCWTNAYTSVVLAASSRVISGASIWLDAEAMPDPASRSPAAAMSGKVWCDSLFMSILLIDACSVQVRSEFFALGGQQRPAQLISLRQPSLGLVAVAGRLFLHAGLIHAAAVTSAFAD